MDKCREEFEAWFYKESALHYEYDKSQVFVKFKEPDDTEDDYYLLAVREAWKAWKASRENMKAIKLPGHSDPLKDKTIMFISDVKKLLESEGINVEVEQ